MSARSDAPHPKVFISYSHDDNEHKKRTLGLAQRLRKDGFETEIDRYVDGTPQQGWPRWMLNQIDWADFVLIVCTETYYRRFRGHEKGEMGKGVDFEGAVITNKLYDEKSASGRFVPVLFNSKDSRYIPEPIQSFTSYVVTNKEAYTKLTSYLAGTAAIQPVKLGPAPSRKRKTSRPISFEENVCTKAAAGPPSCTTFDFSTLCAPGGTMAADDTFYIERRADQKAKAAAARNTETIVIRGPHQFGKSSLLAHYEALCRANKKAVAKVNFSRFEKATTGDYDRFLAALATQLARRLGLTVAVGERKTQQEFLEFIESAILPAVNGFIVFAFDETDRIMRQDYAADFFSMVRMWHDDRADPTLGWNRVGLALVTSSEPKLFIKDALHSPFNVGEKLSLESFTKAEVVQLNARYGSPLSEMECDALHRLLGGHPFLIQDAYYKIFGPDPIPFSLFCSQAAEDQGPFSDHLRAMLSNLNTAGLLAALKQVIDHGTVPVKDDFYRLEGAGLVRHANGRFVPANQIYADFFRSLS